jgi:hypothetical protein
MFCTIVLSFFLLLITDTVEEGLVLHWIAGSSLSGSSVPLLYSFLQWRQIEWFVLNVCTVVPGEKET